MVRIYLIVLLSLIGFSSYLFSQIYISPDGDDANPGTIDLPFKTLTQAVSVSGPDTLIYMRGGIYYDSTTIVLNKSGQPDHYIKLWAYPGEHPIIDFSGQPVSTSSRGIRITHNYWHIKGIEIRNAKDNGIHISSWYNIVEACVIHNCNDTGIQISNGGSYNLILNCDSYLNNDPLNNGENADGFAAKLGIGPGNIFRGCRAWNNSDDGYDMYEAADTVFVDNCWAFRNGYNLWGFPSFAGDGNGFKLGGNFFADPHKIIRSVAFDNVHKGFDQNNNTAGITLYNNTAWGNGERNFSFPSAPTSSVHILKNNISYEGQNNITSGSEQEANSWQGFTVTDADFISLDTSLAEIPRDTNNEIPYTGLFRLSTSSSLIDAGVFVGLTFNGSAPDLGAFETGDPVPVELISFTAAANKEGFVVLKWSTSSELNNHLFEIERAFSPTTKKQWIRIGFIEGNGTTTEQTNYSYIDKAVKTGTYYYRLKQIDFSGQFKYNNKVKVDVYGPLTFDLQQNYPNPFNPSTKMIYSINTSGNVKIQVFDILGCKVSELVNEYQPTGFYELEWTATDLNGRSLPSGTYIVMLQLDNLVRSIKISLLK
ncbi:MAG: right-handed parallel beta-helix repeat-containing protein [Ignavibacteriaceae bacterium]